MIYYQFLISAAIIIVSGIRMTQYADVLSDRLHLGKLWIGVVLLGLVTSLPEAITSFVAILSLHANDLAIGNVLGSINFNVALVIVMDIVYRNGSVTNFIQWNRPHVLPAVFALVLTGIVVGEIILSALFPLPAIGFISVGSLLIAIIYFLGIKTLARHGHLATGVDICVQASSLSQESLSKIVMNVSVSAGLVVLGGVWLANSADALALSTGLGRTFVGGIFLACVTSLPEMVVTISAVRLGALDMAVGNIFGSNMINMFIVFLCDLLYTRGPILSTVSFANVIPGVMSIVLTVVVLIGIRVNNKKTFFYLGWDSWLIASLFILGTVMMYLFR